MAAPWWLLWMVTIWGAPRPARPTSPAPSRHLGRSFAVPFMQNGPGAGGGAGGAGSDFKLLLAASGAATSVSVSMRRPRLRVTLGVTPGRAAAVRVPPQAEMVGSGTFDNVVVLRATEDVAVTLLNEKAASGDAAAVLPVRSWGTEYYAVTPGGAGAQRYAQVALVAWDQAVAVEVHLKAPTAFGGRTHPRGSVLRLRLEPFQGAQLQSAGDLSGSRVAASAPVAVFSGHSCLGRPARCDHAVEQLLPAAAWGSRFVLPPLPWGAGAARVAAGAAARVEVRHGATTTLLHLDPSHAALHGLEAPDALSVEAKRGVQVALSPAGAGAEGGAPEPFMLTVPDVSSYCLSYVAFAQEGYENHVLLVAPAAHAAAITLDGAPLEGASWTPVPGTAYAWASYRLGRGLAAHALRSSAAPFGLLSVGRARDKAYGTAAVCDSDPCRDFQCRARESCRVQDGRPSCVADYLGTCLRSPELQYRTFDGATVTFRPGCPYVVAKSCGADAALVPFAVVETPRGAHGWSALVSIYGYNVSMHKGHGERVEVNEEPVELPLDLDAGKIRVSLKEGRTILETELGLQVTYAEDLALLVAVPSSYVGATCGLCGNFEEAAGAEAAPLPDGADAAGLERWLDPWRDGTCWDFCGGRCPRCRREQWREAGARCGLLGAPGPFEACGALVEPRDYVARCVQEVCGDGGDAGALCGALGSYAAACEERGVALPAWREAAGCAQRCPPNSHFEACAPACPATCAAPRAPASCALPCAPGCRCDGDLLLDRAACVPPARCGGRGGGAGTHATCVATGDPHYTTFDGRRFDFQGSCAYQLAAVCGRPRGDLPPFRVTVENNHRGSRAVSFTKSLRLEVYGAEVTMSQEHPRKVKVNGVFVELPFKQGDEFSVYASGVHGFVRTRFGLRVSFDWHSYARVIAPRAYAGALCGLCGDADGDPANDLPGGDPVALAERWKVADVPGCSSGREAAAAAAAACGEEGKAPYRGGASCGVLRGPPFAACHAALAPGPFVEECAFDACQYKGHRETLCGAVAAYVAACQERGARLGPWRTPEFCSPVCPPNSHYELCGPGCPATCADAADADANGASCESPCAEGCVCDAGFVLSGDECVPAGACGCLHRGRYRKAGQVFYADGGCRQRCRCEAGGAVACAPSACGAHEECRVEGGVLGCHPVAYGRLVVAGDPHHVTFDGRSFHVAGACAYVLARLCGDVGGRANFSVLLESGRPEGRGGGGALVKKVVVAAHGYVVVMERGRAWEVTLDGERHTLPVATEDGQLRVSQEGTNMVLEAALGLQLLYNAASYLLLTVPSTYQGLLCGLGGNYNGDKDDDFRLPDGTVAPSMEEFVASWKVPGEDVACEDGCGADCPACDAPQVAPYRAATSCGLIREPDGPFGRCHQRVSPGDYFSHCLHDVCAAGGARDTLCQSLQAYAAACQAAGASIGAWRSSSFCPLPCPPHSHYALCTRSCEATCAGLAVAAPCGPRCFEGCRCDDGFLFDGAACVSLERCGCLHRGRYLKASESILTHNCTTRCTCHPTQGLRCEETRCGAEETCATREGARRCVRRRGHCRVSPGATMRTFDGAAGRLPGSGTYKVAALCDERSPAWFKVVLEVSECRGDGVPAGAALLVFFRDALVTLNADMEAWVNGIFTHPPANISSAATLTGTATTGLTVSHSSGLRIFFNATGEVTVTAGAQLAGRLCGPCGDFNGDAGDDLTLPNGHLAPSLAQVVDAWRAKDFAGCRVADRGRSEAEAPVYPEQ